MATVKQIIKRFELNEIGVTYSTGRKYPKNPADRIQIKCSYDAYNVLGSYYTQFLREESHAILLNRSNQVIGVFMLSLGGTTGTIIDAKIVFGVAIASAACSVILSHSHPSGNRYPSEADIRITKSLIEAGKHLNINVLDHLIITPSDYLSMADNGDI